MKLQQTSLDQTGVAILRMNGESSEKQIPLFSLKPVEEAQSIVSSFFPTCERIEAVYFTNNLMEVKIEDIIANYRKNHENLPEDYMEELLSGFPYVIGAKPAFNKAFYA